MNRLRSALWLPLFDELADPRVVANLAAEAEEAGWDGCFVWDHLSWRAPVQQVADSWIALATIATATERLRLGPMVSTLARRRPAKVARETATLDQLSGGRLTLGVGLGSDRFGGELSKTGEQLDDRQRGRMLDESLAILAAAWSGEPVRHRGETYTVDDITFLPRPVQRPGVPVWAAGFPGNVKPIRRAARLDGFFPINLEHPDQLATLAADHGLIPNAIEELLRYETPAPHVGRCVAKDVELHGRTVPPGSAILLLVGAANRDDRRFPDGDRFDIHRTIGQHLTFGYGIHFCLGAALARLEGRIALDEVLTRFPEWDIDMDSAKLSSTSTVRGWETMPAVIR